MIGLAMLEETMVGVGATPPNSNGRPRSAGRGVTAGDAVVDLNLSKAPVTAFEAATAASRMGFPVVNAGMGGSWVAAVPKIAATPAPVAA